MEFEHDPTRVAVALLILSAVGALAVTLSGVLRLRLIERDVRRAKARLSEENALLRQRAGAIEALQAETERLTEEIRQANVARSSLNLKAKKVGQAALRFIHEIGRKEPHNSAFSFTLSALGNWERKPPERIIFHPTIWKHRNIVVVQAQEFAAALTLIRSIFNEASGVEVGHPTDAMEPAPAPEPAIEADASAEDPAA